jgi:hypothetical protein
MNKLSVFPVVLALVAALSSTNAACPCLYTDEDAEDCLVYGKIDGELVPWMRASQECLDVYDIKINAPDPSLICASSNGFVNSLRSGRLSSSTVKYGLGVSQMDGGFWAESGTNNLPVIKDSITINGITTACTPDEVQVDCYTAMKPYFGSDPDGQQEMKDVCETLETQRRNSLELEQSTLRLRLCIEDDQGSTIRQVCDSMWQEVSQKIEENPDRECQFLSFGPGTTTLPDCDDGGGGGGGDSASHVGIAAIVAVSLSLMLTNIMLW